MKRAPLTFFAVLLGLVAARVGMDLLERGRLDQTAALYVGLPAVIAAVIILTLGR